MATFLAGWTSLPIRANIITMFYNKTCAKKASPRRQSGISSGMASRLAVPVVGLYRNAPAVRFNTSSLAGERLVELDREDEGRGEDVAQEAVGVVVTEAARLAAHGFRRRVRLIGSRDKTR